MESRLAGGSRGRSRQTRRTLPSLQPRAEHRAGLAPQRGVLSRPLSQPLSPGPSPGTSPGFPGTCWVRNSADGFGGDADPPHLPQVTEQPGAGSPQAQAAGCVSPRSGPLSLLLPRGRDTGSWLEAQPDLWPRWTPLHPAPLPPTPFLPASSTRTPPFRPPSLPPPSLQATVPSFWGCRSQNRTAPSPQSFQNRFLLFPRGPLEINFLHFPNWLRQRENACLRP